MKKKIFFWILGIIGIMIIAGGVYAYNVYSTVSKTLDTVHKPLNREKRNEKVTIGKNQPISILMLGVDEREGDKGRSDSLMLLTLNPKDKSMKIVSIPRDSYTEIVGKGKKIKLIMLTPLVVLIWQLKLLRTFRCACRSLY